MYAVIATGGKQFKVSLGSTLEVEKLSAEIGDSVEFPILLLVSEPTGPQIGAPFLEKVAVKATVLKHGLGEKVKITKFRRRKHFKKCQGHRQPYTKVEVIAFTGDSHHGT